MHIFKSYVQMEISNSNLTIQSFAFNEMGDGRLIVKRWIGKISDSIKENGSQITQYQRKKQQIIERDKTGMNLVILNRN